MLHIYRYLTFLLFPAFVILIYLRSIFNKEDQVRYKEKIFSSSFKVNRNAKKKLFWFHAASIGEVMSILTLIQEINISNKNSNIHSYKYFFYYLSGIPSVKNYRIYD